MGILCRDRGGGERPTQKSPTSGLIFSIFFGLIIRAIHHGENTHSIIGMQNENNMTAAKRGASIYLMQVLILRMNILPSGRESGGVTARQ